MEALDRSTSVNASIAIRDALLFVANERVWVASISDPDRPRIIGRPEIDRPVREIAILASGAIVAACDSGLEVLVPSSCRQ